MLVSILIIWYIAIVNGLTIPTFVGVIMSIIIAWKLFKFVYFVTTNWDDIKKEVEEERGSN